MSAWDVAGAAAGLCLFALGALSVLTAADRSELHQTGNAVFAAVGLVWCAFCVARLFGARL